VSHTGRDDAGNVSGCLMVAFEFDDGDGNFEQGMIHDEWQTVNHSGPA